MTNTAHGSGGWKSEMQMLTDPVSGRPASWFAVSCPLAVPSDCARAPHVSSQEATGSIMRAPPS